MSARRCGTIAVSLHDIEPATFERCALIRDWLDDHGIDRVTLLVIPAPDLHPFHDRRPELAEWLGERARGGDAIAQHGFQHRQLRRPAGARQIVARAQGGGAEFIGLDGDETRRAVLAGRRVLRLAGIQPRGFVAPAYAYTPALRRTLAATFDWWAGLGHLHRANRSATVAPALCLGTSTRFKRWTSPLVVRAGAVASGELLRLEIHPADVEHPRCIGAAEHVLRGARHRTPVTYDDLSDLSGASGARAEPGSDGLDLRR
jgi:predicted deacetylase